MVKIRKKLQKRTFKNNYENMKNTNMTNRKVEPVVTKGKTKLTETHMPVKIKITQLFTNDELRASM